MILIVYKVAHMVKFKNFNREHVYTCSWILLIYIYALHFYLNLDVTFEQETNIHVEKDSKYESVN